MAGFGIPVALQRHRLHCLGRLFHARSFGFRLRLLLRLRSFQDVRWLQQNVRTAEIRFALVGYQLPQATRLRAS